MLSTVLSNTLQRNGVTGMGGIWHQQQHFGLQVNNTTRPSSKQSNTVSALQTLFGGKQATLKLPAHKLDRLRGKE